MQTVIIGSGNVAYHLAKAFVINDIPVKQIFGRNSRNLEEISLETKIPFSTVHLENADLYIICVNDESVGEVSAKIIKTDALVAHTSGSLPVQILQGNFRKASFYPLQTFSKTKDLNYSSISFFIEAEDKADENLLKMLATKISHRVMNSTYEQRKYVHLIAVFVCNFVNHLLAKAKEIADAQQIPFDYFLPLITETVEKIHHLEPKLAQTGPAIRNDRHVLDIHEALLENEALKIYQTLNESIQKMYGLR